LCALTEQGETWGFAARSREIWGSCREVETFQKRFVARDFDRDECECLVSVAGPDATPLRVTSLGELLEGAVPRCDAQTVRVTDGDESGVVS
jgi:hypothetical protein